MLHARTVSCCLVLLFPVIIPAQPDPTVLWSTPEVPVRFGEAVLDPQGNIVAVGLVTTGGLATRGAFQENYGGGECSAPRTPTVPCFDLYIAKFNGADGRLLAATYFGGSGNDSPGRITVDRTGAIYITGTSLSTSFLPQGATGTFLLKLDATLSRSLYLRVFAPSSAGAPVATIVDDSGASYLVGNALNAAEFPVTAGALRAAMRDVAFYAVKLSPEGTIIYSALVGRGFASAAIRDTRGNLVVVGRDEFGQFPWAQGETPIANSSSDAFIVKLNADGTELTSAARIGGALQDAACNVIEDLQGSLYLLGSTTANTRDEREGPPYPPGLWLVKMSNGVVKWRYTVPGDSVRAESGRLFIDTGRIRFTGETGSHHIMTTPRAFRRCLRWPLNVDSFLVTLDTVDGQLIESTYLNTTPVLAEPGNRRLITWSGDSFSRRDLNRVPSERVECISNAAYPQYWAVSPGMIVSIFGDGLGPETGAGTQLDATGRVSKTLAGVQVFFDDIASPVLFARRDQINAIVPFAMAGKQQARVRIEYAGRRIDAGMVTLREIVPAVFRYLPSERAVVLNQDGSLNSPENPADLGQVITFWATGMGLYDTGNEDGFVFAGPVALRRRAVVNFGDFFGVVRVAEYSGSAPNFVAGASQINVRLPDAIPSVAGESPTTLRIAVIEPDVGSHAGIGVVFVSNK